MLNKLYDTFHASYGVMLYLITLSQIKTTICKQCIFHVDLEKKINLMLNKTEIIFLKCIGGNSETLPKEELSVRSALTNVALKTNSQVTVSLENCYFLT